LLRLLVTEAVVLGVLAGAAGLGLALVVGRWIRVSGRDLLPRADEVTVDPGVLLVVAALALLVWWRSGFCPRFAAWSPSLLRSGKEGPRAAARVDGGSARP
jgi:hypothetical protein